MLKNLSGRMFNVSKMSDVYTSSSKVLSNSGVLHGVWVALTDAAVGISLTVYDTTLASGTLTSETKMTPGTITIADTELEYYCDMHNQYYTEGVYVDLTTTSGTFAYRVVYDS